MNNQDNDTNYERDKRYFQVDLLNVRINGCEVFVKWLKKFGMEGK